MEDRRAKFIFLINICLRIVNEEGYQIVVAVIGSKMKRSEFFIGGLVSPILQNSIFRFKVLNAL